MEKNRVQGPNSVETLGIVGLGRNRQSSRTQRSQARHDLIGYDPRSPVIARRRARTT